MNDDITDYLDRICSYCHLISIISSSLSSLDTWGHCSVARQWATSTPLIKCKHDEDEDDDKEEVEDNDNDDKNDVDVIDNIGYDDDYDKKDDDEDDDDDDDDYVNYDDSYNEAT